MNNFWKQILGLLTPGVRFLLTVMTVAGLLAFIGQVTSAFDFNGWLVLTAQHFWHGQIWRIVTYALLPLGILNFIFNAFALVMLGGWLERVRSKGEFWTICIVSAAGAGLADVSLPFSNSVPLAGGGPMIFGLLTAWSFHCGHERILMIPFGEMRAGRLALVAGVITLLLTFFSAGWRFAVIMAAGGLSGWLYVWLWHKWVMSRPSRIAASERISRLEL